MAYNTPGVFINEETPQLTPLITAGTGVAGFLGFSTRGPSQLAVALDSYEDLLRTFGAPYTDESTFNSVKMFFENGGSRAYFVRLSDYDVATGAENADAASTEVATQQAGALTIKAGYRGNESVGTEGNSLYVQLTENPMHPSAGRGQDLVTDLTAGNDVVELSGLIGIRAGTLLKFFTDDSNNDSTIGDDTTEYHVVRRVESRLESGVIKHYAYLETTIVAATAFKAATTTVESVEYDVAVYNATSELLESYSQLSLSESADNNMLAIINDSELGSRFITLAYAPNAADKGALDVTETILTSQVQLSGGTAENAGATSAMFAGSEALGKGIHAFDAITELNIICAPPTLNPTTNTWSIQGTAVYHSLLLQYAEGRMDVFAILDPAIGKTTTEIKQYRETSLGVDTPWGALYYPFLKIQDPERPQSSATILVPPSGAVAGCYARVDALPAPDGGVSAAAAGVGINGVVRNVVGLEIPVSDKEQALLNPVGVNCIRRLVRASGSQGIFIYGARTLSTAAHMKYIPMRRTMTYIEETVRLSSQFAIFKKNGPEIWSRLSLLIDTFLRDFWEEGNLKGASPAEAFFVTIDSTTTTAVDIENGIIRGKIGVSLFRPAEFIVFTFTQAQSGSSVEEI